MSITEELIRTTAPPPVEPAFDVVCPGQRAWSGTSGLDLDKRLKKLSTCT